MERRKGLTDSGQRRRRSDMVDEFALMRDRVLLGIGSVIVVAIAGAAIFLPIRNTEVALAALTVGAGLLGAPSIIRFDEVRQRRKRSES